MKEPIATYLQGSISMSLVRLAKAHRQQSGVRCQRIGLHTGQEHVIFRLLEDDGLSQSQLAARLKVEIGTVAKMVQRMEKEGLLIRREDAEDARISRVYLTEKGRALGEPAAQILQDLDACMVQGMSQAEQLLFQRLLDQAAANVARCSLSPADEHA
ncbi:MarR family winged helix-turn-helix transcriptional regulator [Ktedonobacter sp. SOSP1-52]|uniref:MarR family winged helix-turn-helix transcriptional regulator n=1 Tax=Ktedonobacter sp. SOSP1-52 TaxID=2778366 RepID=UPI001916B2B1|nr:MarR family transcriptional regulator [Ktedonobacter sp. SOSP1-52]